MGYLKVCGSLHITPEPGHGPRPIVPPGSSPGLAQCEYSIVVR